MAYESLTSDKVRALSDEDLAALTREMRDKLFTLRSQAVTEKVEDTSQFGKVRKDVARLLTEGSRRRSEASAAA